MMASFFVQSSFIILAAALLETNAIPDNIAIDWTNDPGLFLKLIPLALIAFQSAGQMAASRLLSFNEIPTTVLTSVYYDLISDPALISPVPSNPKRNRRITGVVAVLCGAIVGGWLARTTGGISTSFWMAAALKMCMAVAWWLWKPEDQKQPKEVVHVR